MYELADGDYFKLKKLRKEPIYAIHGVLDIRNDNMKLKHTIQTKGKNTQII
jgi:hypothetical protein|tara:strand:+ start:1058 stop:1210 length:153 start_codon:yes stop_codon:yes gene_type:complete